MFNFGAGVCIASPFLASGSVLATGQPLWAWIPWFAGILLAGILLMSIGDRLDWPGAYLSKSEISRRRFENLKFERLLGELREAYASGNTDAARRIYQEALNLTRMETRNGRD